MSLPALAIGAMTPTERAAGRYMRAPDGHDGGAAEALAAAAPPADPPPADPPPADPPPADPPPADPSLVADPEWLEKFSAEGGDADNPSNRDWLKAKGFKSLDDLAKSYREAEHAIRNGGKFTVPGENAKPEEVAAYHKAIGVPESADKYEFALPEGVTEDQLDVDLLSPMRELAHQAGVPAGGFKALAEGLVKHQLDTMDAMKKAEDADFGEWKKAQGDQFSAKMVDVGTAMRALKLDQVDVAAMQRGFALTYGKPGSTKVMGLLSQLGAGLAEDALLGGGGPRRFGITGAEAQAEVDKLVVDSDFQTKLSNKDPEAVARWDRLNGAIAADRDAKARVAAAS